MVEIGNVLSKFLKKNGLVRYKAAERLRRYVYVFMAEAAIRCTFQYC
jgi:hypothetical protein